MKNIFLLSSIISCVVFIGCKNSRNNQEFSFSEDTISYPLGLISNVDSKFGFKNLKLESKCGAYRFGEKWLRHNAPTRFTLLSVVKPDTKIGDLRIQRILLTFFDSTLISIDVSLEIDTIDLILTNGQFDRIQRLPTLLLEMFGQPNDMNFTFCECRSTILMPSIYSDYLHIFNEPRQTVNPSFLYTLNPDDIGCDTYKNEITGARWKGEKAILEYFLQRNKVLVYVNQKEKYIGVSRFRYILPNYYELISNYFANIKNNESIQDSILRQQKQQHDMELEQDSIDKFLKARKGRIKGL